MGRRGYPPKFKHHAVKRWNAIGGSGGTVAHVKLLEDLGCSQSSIERWRKDGFGASVPPPSLPDEGDNDFMAWLLSAIDYAELDPAMADALIAHRVRWTAKQRRP